MLGRLHTLFHFIAHSTCSHFEWAHLREDVCLSKITNLSRSPWKEPSSLHATRPYPASDPQKNLEDLLRIAAHIMEVSAERSLCTVLSPRGTVIWEVCWVVRGAVLSLQRVWKGFSKLQQNHNQASDNTEHKLKDQYQWWWWHFSPGFFLFCFIFLFDSFYAKSFRFLNSKLIAYYTERHL